jgi:hypothetical protein
VRISALRLKDKFVLSGVLHGLVIKGSPALYRVCDGRHGAGCMAQALLDDSGTTVKAVVERE